MRLRSTTWTVTATAAFLALLPLAVSDAEPMDGGLKPADLRELAKRFATFNDRLPDPEMLGLSRILAFEEHPYFVYAMGDLPDGDDRPAGMRRIVFFKPATFVVDDQLAGGTRSTVVLPAGESEPVPWKAVEKSGAKQITLSAGDCRCDLVFPNGPGEGTIAVTGGENKLLPDRLLPAGIMPHGPNGVAMVERWDERYRGENPAPWDSGSPSRWLVEMIEDGTIKPGRVVELGCGSGTNSIYLATRGFDVTALDIAPTALAMAREKAARAGVKVRWLLADVLAPPALEPFDFIFDSGCYHGVRRGNAAGYIRTANSLAKTGALMLILAGNANEPRHYGPPRVEETHLVGDFAETWDFVSLRELRPGAGPNRESGAWFWSALMRRRPK